MNAIRNWLAWCWRLRTFCPWSVRLVSRERPPAFVYNGRVYVRPVGRGICLIDYPDDWQLEQLVEEELGSGYFDAEIVIRPMTKEREKATDDEWLP